MIMEVIDLPPTHILAEATRRKLFFDSKGAPRNLNTKMFKKRRPGSRPLSQILKTTDNNFIDFVRRCLEYGFYIFTVDHVIISDMSFQTSCLSFFEAGIQLND
jgi:hypothetical protein